MPDNPPHRKSVKHEIKPGVARELTFSCYRRQPLIDDDAIRSLLSEAIDRAVERHRFNLVAFVYMPEHVHLLVYPRDVGDVSSLLAGIKRPHSFRVRKLMEHRADERLGRLMIRERPGRRVFRFWQEGSGYDRDIESGGYLREAAEYMHANPVRRNLVATPDQWPWSSWHHYHAATIPPGLPTIHGMPDADLLS